MRIKIAIATNINFYQLSLPIVIESLINSGIEKSDIFVFNAGFEESKHEVIDGITHYYMNQNSYEYSPLIEIVEKEIESDYWFLIHDTCKVGPKFKELLYNIPDTLPNTLALKQKPAMSMGSYKYDFLLSVKDRLLSIKNTDYSYDSMMRWKLWGVDNEDYISWMANPETVLYNNNNNWEIIAYENWFGTPTIRRTEYFHSLDLYKNKSNWGQTAGRMVMSI